MKKLLAIFLTFFPLISVATNMGNYLDLMDSIELFENLSNNQTYESDVINYSRKMINATNQTIAETIMLIVAESEDNKKPIFCFPEDFYLDSSVIAQLVAEGFNNSKLPINRKRSMPVALFAIIELHKKYPCDNK